ncbi:MAG: hypothetical protein A2167_03250 [Planctomycetes bacterium RBG_13_46_10]|nr:MAG: hypothetical protein A2167_03250 [Planctomycetes bacterium RBG_13_46_10]
MFDLTLPPSLKSPFFDTGYLLKCKYIISVEHMLPCEIASFASFSFNERPTRNYAQEIYSPIL